MELFLELCPAHTFGITGSDGKTTTTTLIYLILKEQGYNCWLGGNIGTPLLDKIDEINPGDMVVLELSSFQLMSMKCSPNIAVVTNVTPNHLDVHTSYQEYIDAKKNIMRFQNEEDILVLNHDNETSRNFANEANAQVKFFGREKKFTSGVHIKNNFITYNDKTGAENYLPIEKILLPGVHNIENVMTAIAAVQHCVDPHSINRVASTFRGVEHRIEPVRKVNEIRFYNDSIASSPNRTIAGLNSFKEKVILIAGGKDKNSDYSPLGKAIMEKVKYMVLVGATSDKIEQSYLQEIEKHKGAKKIGIKRCSNLEDAVMEAYYFAEPGDAVLFSPASTSFDLYRNFEERGNKFKEIVNRL
jgi:UDP-N-acetylmuramoylalanine--D-glutamate ligase